MQWKMKTVCIARKGQWLNWFYFMPTPKHFGRINSSGQLVLSRIAEFASLALLARHPPTAANQTDAVTTNGRTNTLNLVGLATVANATTTTTTLNRANSNNNNYHKSDWQAKAFLRGNERRLPHVVCLCLPHDSQPFDKGTRNVAGNAQMQHTCHQARARACLVSSTCLIASLIGVAQSRKLHFAFT